MQVDAQSFLARYQEGSLNPVFSQGNSYSPLHFLFHGRLSGENAVAGRHSNRIAIPFEGLPLPMARVNPGSRCGLELFPKPTFVIVPVASGRLPILALERTIESRFRLVSDVRGDFRDTSRCAFERSRSQL
jgi:hypothetical protein